MNARLHLSSASATVLLSLVASVASQCDVTWLYPINGQMFNYNDTIIASWVSSCAKPDILVWGPNANNSAQVYWDQASVNSTGDFAFSFFAGIGTFDQWPFPAHFQLEYNATADFAGVYGYTFSVTSTAGPPTTYALSSTVTQASTTSTLPSTTASSIPSAIRSSQAPSTATPSATNIPVAAAQPSGLSAGAKAGIGVGVALGVLIVIAALAWGFMSRRKLRRHQRAMEAEKNHIPAEQVALAQWSDAKWTPRELHSQSTRHEMSSDRPTHELDSQGVISPLLSSDSSFVPVQGTDPYSSGTV